MSVLRKITVVLFGLSLVCLVAPTTIFDASWPTWTVSGLLAWALDGPSLNITVGKSS